MLLLLLFWNNPHRQGGVRTTPLNQRPVWRPRQHNTHELRGPGTLQSSPQGCLVSLSTAGEALLFCVQVSQRGRETEWERRGNVNVCVLAGGAILAALWPAERLNFYHSLHKYPQQYTHQAAGTSLPLCILPCLLPPFLPPSSCFCAPLLKASLFCFISYS